MVIDFNMAIIRITEEINRIKLRSLEDCGLRNTREDQSRTEKASGEVNWEHQFDT